MEKICRTCLRRPEILLPLFDDELPEKIETVTSVQIFKTDNLPTEICAECVININLAFNFRRVVMNSDQELKRRITPMYIEKDIVDTKNDEELLIPIEKSEPEEQLSPENVYDPLENIEDAQVDIEMETNNTTQNQIENSIKPPQEEIKELRVPVPRGIMQKNYLYKCRVCDFVTPDFSKYKEHIKTDTVVQKSICSVCGKTVRSNNLTKHMTIHTESPVKCKYCGKMCKNSPSLRSHLFIHKNVKLQCNICDKVYTYRSGFHQHIKRHTMGDVRTATCSICSKQFFDKRTLKRHMLSHTGERPYTCEYCKKGFTSSHALKTHKRRHTNEKPYICEFCPMAFPQKVSLKTHRKSKHPEAPDL